MVEIKKETLERVLKDLYRIIELLDPDKPKEKVITSTGQFGKEKKNIIRGNIEGETAKALLISVDGVETWVPKSTIKNDYVKDGYFQLLSWFYERNFGGK